MGDILTLGIEHIVALGKLYADKKGINSTPM